MHKAVAFSSWFGDNLVSHQLSPKHPAVIRLFLIVCACFVTIVATPTSVLRGATPAAGDVTFFETNIRPVLVKHCYECHAAGSKELGGKLLLDSREGIRKGGESGPAIVAGKPNKSLLIQGLRYDGLEMPPDQPLPESVVNDFVRWVELGAPDPRGPNSSGSVKQVASEPDDGLWSFQPVRNSTPPDVQNYLWPRDSLDRFVLSRIEDAGLAPSPDADPQTLVRRLYFDLIGLPPTLDDVEEFIADQQRYGDEAIERLADRLLARPQFGERWGRFWLDVARFGESNGNDGLGRNPTFPHAWRYRDYVIAAFNEDRPYDQFLTEQIAGDLLLSDSASAAGSPADCDRVLGDRLEAGKGHEYQFRHGRCGRSNRRDRSRHPGPERRVRPLPRP